MKKTLSLLLAVLMIFSMTACDNNDSQGSLDNDTTQDVGGGDNTGDDNTGDNNTGGDNTGDNNTGGDNTGDDNTGDDNTGGDNTGDDNTGDDNTGDEGDTPVEPTITHETYGSYWLPQTDYTTMPIGAYNGLPPNGEQMSVLKEYTFDYDEVLSDYNELGVNFLFGLYNKANANIAYEKTTLELCDKYDISYLSVWNGAHFETEASMQNQKNILNELTQYSSFLGISMVDEPGYKSFAHMSTAKSAFKNAIGERADDYLYHSNLLPNWAGCEPLYNYQAGDYAETDWNVYKDYTYAQYLSDYMSIYKPQILSYDFYPMVGQGNTLKDGYFENLSVIRKEALKANVPFWTFVQTCAWEEGQRLPTQGELLWNVNTCLAYGAKGIQYFCGIEPWNSAPSEHFSGSLFYKDGTHVPVVYDSALLANKQIQAIDEVLMCSKNEGVIFVGQMPLLSEGSGAYMTKSTGDTLTGYKQLSSVSAHHALIGCFDYNGKTALYVVNNSTTKKSGVNLQFSGSAPVKGYCIRGGVKDNGFSASSLSLNLEIGEGVLVVIE